MKAVPPCSCRRKELVQEPCGRRECEASRDRPVCLEARGKEGSRYELRQNWLPGPDHIAVVGRVKEC